MLALVAAACSSSGGDDSSTASSAPATTALPSDPTATTVPLGDGCPAPRSPEAPEGPSADAVTLETDTGVQVDLVRYPRPDSAGDPWSQWGQGLVLPDGRFLSAMGDHGGADANSYLFVYDPATRRITRFTDLLSHTDHEPGAWGFGKVHAPMVPGPCGEVYLSSYWGSSQGLTYTDGYDGDVLFRLDQSLALEAVAVPVAEHGLPSLAAVASEGLVYGEAHDPERTGPDRGAFFVYDVEQGEVVFRSDDERHIGFRSILVDGDGTAYLAAEGGRLLVWEPGADELTVHPETLPGGQWLRAATVPAPDGTVYGVTNREANRLFALRPDGSIDDLGSAGEYTASLALDPTGGRVYWVPGAHGEAWQDGTPLMALDTATGEQTVVAELNELAERELGLTLGGTYDVAVDPSGELVYIGFNAGPDHDETFGETVLAVVHLP
jgi:hypothetical protein